MTGRAVARQHVERIGERFARAFAGVGGVDHLIAQMVERLVEAVLRHGERPLARPGQEVGDEGVEPQVVAVASAAHRPKAPFELCRVISRSIASLTRRVEIGVDRRDARARRAG